MAETKKDTDNNLIPNENGKQFTVSRRVAASSDVLCIEWNIAGK